MKHVHVVGCPRSGTTLLTEMMIASFSLEGHCEHEETIFKAPAGGYDIYLSKKPNDILWMEQILDIDPDLHVIALLRDPRAVICSIHQGHQGMYFCNYPVWKRAEQALQRIMRHPRVMLVRYEDLVADPDAVQQRIIEQMPFLEPTGSFSQFHQRAKSSEASQKALGGVRHVDSKRVAGWRAHLPRLKQQLDRYPGLADDLLRYGYETDRAWLQELADVSPVRYPCRYPDSNQWWKRLEQNLRFRQKIRRFRRARSGASHA